ncbi:MAG: glyoxalase [Allosphingosinicella sp.]
MNDGRIGAGAAYGERPTTPFGLSLHHVLLAIPAGSEDACRAFWVDGVGFTELRKPPALAGRGGLWLRADGVEIHLGVEADFRPARKAHPGIQARDVEALAGRIARLGHAITWDELFPGMRRFYVDDPCGNRLEFLGADDSGLSAW